MPAAVMKRRRKRKLPMQQLTILAICRFAEPIAATSLFPYLPEMIRSFDVPENKVGKWAGLCSAVFSLCQAVLGVPWGRFSDRYGRKPAILIGLACTMVTSLMWGFSTNLGMAIFARGISGAGSGNVGIIRTTVAEMVPFKELQPRAFSIMPLVWSIGSIFGPAFGGALANPYNVKPGETISNPNLLQRFPYALPNIVSSCFFLVGIVTGTLFLEETLETIHTRDRGLVLGDRIKRAFRSFVEKLTSILRRRDSRLATNGETEPLLKAAADEESLPLRPDTPKLPPPSYRDVLNKQAVLNLVVYTLLALHNVGFDQLIPVYAQYPPLGSKVEGTGISMFSSDNPLKFAGGFGLNHTQIGLLNTAYGVCGMLIQFFVFPPVARRFGVLNCLRVCVCVFPMVYLAIPFTALLPTRASQVGCCFAIMVVKCFCSIFSIPSSTILLTNCASSLRVLGTLNGFATSFSALGRAAGPALGGSMFTVGVERGYVIAPWWTFCAMALIAAVPVFFLVEGEGFGGDYDDLSDDEEEVQVEESALPAVRAEDPETVRAVIAQTREQLEEQAESEYGGMGPLTRSTTLSSALSFDGDVIDVDGHAGEAGDRRAPLPATAIDRSRRRSRAEGSAQEGSSSTDQPNSLRANRRASLPIGMRGRPISRRYSSNLGQSLEGGGSYQG